MTLDPKTFIMTSDVVGCDVMDNATQRYSAFIDLDPAAVVDPALTLLTQLTISVQDPNCAADYYPYLGMDEACTYLTHDLCVEMHDSQQMSPQDERNIVFSKVTLNTC
jgi:hypothetical protein